MKSFISKLRALCTNAFDSIGNRETHADGGGTPVSYTANDLNQHTAAGLVNYHLLILDETDTILRKFTWGMDIAEQAAGLPRGGRPGAGAGGVGGLLGVEEVSGSQAGDYVYFYDANGNVGQVLNWDAGTVAAHYQYDPFGREITATGNYAAINRFRFSTKHLDPETDLYYYGYRYYSPEMGRWLNRDPIGERGGLTLNGFVRNDPKNKVDPLGLQLLPPDPGDFFDRPIIIWPPEDDPGDFGLPPIWPPWPPQPPQPPPPPGDEDEYCISKGHVIIGGDLSCSYACLMKDGSVQERWIDMGPVECPAPNPMCPEEGFFGDL